MNHEETRRIIESLLTYMSIPFTSIELNINDQLMGYSCFAVETPEAAFLIGSRGENASAFNYIVRKIVERRFPGETARFIVDINDYYKQSIEELRQKAFILAERAKSFRSNVEMDPMTPFERMIVHSLLQSDPNVRTESVGEGKERRVVIKFVG